MTLIISDVKCPIAQTDAQFSALPSFVSTFSGFAIARRYFRDKFPLPLHAGIAIEGCQYACWIFNAKYHAMLGSTLIEACFHARVGPQASPNMRDSAAAYPQPEILRLIESFTAALISLASASAHCRLLCYAAHFIAIYFDTSRDEIMKITASHYRVKDGR